MGVSHLISFLACAGLLLLVVLVLVRGREGPLRLPVALLALDMFVWNFAMLALALGGGESWRWIDNAASPLTPPLALHVVLVFVGRMERLRWVAIAAYVGGLGLGLVSLAGLASPAAARWVASSGQGVIFLTLMIPEALLMAALLLIHLRRQVREVERMRSRLLLAALGLGALFGSTELWDDFLPLPALGQLGAMSMALLVSLVVVQLRSPNRDDLARTLGYSLGLTLLSLSGYLAVARWAATNIALALVAGSAITAALFFAAAEVLRKRRGQRWADERRLLLDDLATELAHELRNPLAAIKGANEVIRRARPSGDVSQDEFFSLINEQVERIDAVVERYRHLGAGLREIAVDLEPLLEQIVDQRLAEPLQRAGLRVELTVEPLPEIVADPLQLGQAVEELVLAAIDNAGPEDALLSIGACVGRLDALTPAIVIEVSGVADGRESFGLGIARRAVEAHGGELRRGDDRRVQLLVPVG
jgi:two-component system sensor histidine kinase HydH